MKQIRNIFRKNFENFISENSCKTFEYSIHDKTYKILVSNIIKLMNMDKEQFLTFCKKNLEFVHGVLLFFDKMKIFNAYDMPQIYYNRVNDLKFWDVYNIDYLNGFNNEVSKYNIDILFKEEILRDMPNELNLLEQAIYIYIKLCINLSYNEEFYVLFLKEKPNKIYENEDFIESVNLLKNEVICYHFNDIFANFLNGLSLKYKKEKTSIGDFGEGHAKLYFRYFNFLIDVDAVSSILRGDIGGVKFGNCIQGLKCLNKDASMQKEFLKSIKKVYNYIKNNDDLHLKDDSIFYQSILDDYEKRDIDLSTLNIFERLNILIEILNSRTRQNMDSLSYCIFLIKKVFSIDEIYNSKNVMISFIRNKETNDDKVARASVIFAVRANITSPYQYFLYNPNESLVKVEQEYIQNKFDENIYGYIRPNDPLIPGINKKLERIKTKN